MPSFDNAGYYEWGTCPAREEETPQWCWSAIRLWSEYDKGKYFYHDEPLDEQPHWFVTICGIVGSAKHQHDLAKTKREE